MASVEQSAAARCRGGTNEWCEDRRGRREEGEGGGHPGLFLLISMLG